MKVDGTTVIVSGDQLASPITLKKVTTVSGYAATYELQNGAGAKIGDAINLFQDQFLSGARYDATTEEIVLDFIVANPAGGTSAGTVRCPVSGLVQEFDGVYGVAIDYVANGNSKIKGVIDGTNNDGYLKLGANGFYTSGIDTAITAATSDIAADVVTLSTNLGTVSGNLNTVSGELDALEARITGTIDAAAVAGDAIPDAGAVSAFVDDKISDLAGDTTDGLETLSAALSGYLSANAVSSEFAAQDGRLDTLEAKTSDTIETGDLVKWDGSKYADANVAVSTAKVTSSSTDTQLPTAKAVYDSIDSAISCFVTGDSLTSGKIVLGSGDKAVETSGVGILKDSGTWSDIDDSNVPTVAKVDSYINDDLSGILTAVNALKTAIDGNSPVA